MKKEYILVFIPFAFGGNPSSESGPKCIYELIQKKSKYKDIKKIILDQSINESPLMFLKRVENTFSNILTSKYKKMIIIGGNHLSIFPLYHYLYSDKCSKTIFTLDAHRDYYPGMLNHATFLKYLPDNISPTKHYIIGARDFDRHNNVHDSISVISDTTMSHQFIKKHKDICLLDIDVDVMNPLLFPWCGSAISGGLNSYDIEKMIIESRKNDCPIMAISEYIPNWDYEFVGATMIETMIDKFLFEE